MSTGTAHRTTSSPTGADRTRQVAVSAAEVFCVIGTLVGVGVLGTTVEDTAGGALSADATLLAPAGTAFSIWSVVYAGLLAFTLWQWLPRRAAEARMRSLGWLAALSMVLNASWLLVTQQGWIWGSVVVIVALLATLVEIARRLAAAPATSWGEWVVVDGTFGLYLGWVAAATCANLAAALVDGGVAVTVPIAVVVLVALVAGLTLLFSRIGTRVAAVVATGWGLAWIAAGRLGDEPRSTTTAVLAVVALVALVAVGLRWRTREVRA